MKRYFDCQCGKKNIDSTDRSASDKSHNVDRCKECYSVWHGKSVAEKARIKAETYKQRQIEQAAERHAKAEEFAKEAEEFAREAEVAARPKKKTPVITSKQRTKQGIDEINFQIELNKINEEFAL